MINKKLHLSKKLFKQNIDQVPTRNGYGEGLVEAGKINENIVSPIRNRNAESPLSKTHVFGQANKLRKPNTPIIHSAIENVQHELSHTDFDNDIFDIIDEYFTHKYRCGYSPTEYHRKALASAIHKRIRG